MRRPTFADDDEYAARLGDVEFWVPYVAEALARHGLPTGAPEVGNVGTVPTFLVGRHAVKLFGERFFGPECHAAERPVLRLLLDHPEIPTATLVAEGELFGGARPDDGWSWPYLITARLAGRAWSGAAPSPPESMAIARALGRAMRRVHALPPPSGPTWERDWLAELYATCTERHRAWGMLPAHLIEQIDGYLVGPAADRRVVHADLHADHVFVDGGRLVGIIDWGDAILADPAYDLPALHLLTFRGAKALLHAFLAGYGWDAGGDFARRAMSMALAHEFNPLGELRATVDFGAIATLDELANLIWALS